MEIEAASRWFDTWADNGRADSMAEGHWPAVSQILAKMDLGSGLTCVDVGCGDGYAVRALGERIGSSGSVLGLDVSPQMIQQAEAHDDNPANVRYEIASANELPLESDSVDRLLSVETLYYFSDPLSVLREWNRVLAPGGSVWIMMDYYKENPYSHSWPQAVKIPMQLFSEKEVRQLVEKAGFTAVVSERIHNDNPMTDEEHSRFQPGWGYRKVDDVLRFRNDIGSLMVCGKKSALDISE